MSINFDRGHSDSGYSNFDRTINNIENTLSDVAAYPVAGILAGTAKVILGVTQSLTALVCGILNFIPAVASGDWSLMRHSWTHIKHGLGNIAGGTLEAIPLVGTTMYFIRQVGKHAASDAQVNLHTSHENKWMPYTSLVARDWKIGGNDDKAVEKATEVFHKKIKENGGMINLSYKRQMELAQEAIRGMQSFLHYTRR